MKSINSLLGPLVLVVLLVTLFSMYSDDSSAEVSGSFQNGGDYPGPYKEVHWIIDDDGNLTITGNSNYLYPVGNLPSGDRIVTWDDYKDLVKTVSIGSSFKDYARFSYYPLLTTVYLNNVPYISATNCPQLEHITCNAPVLRVYLPNCTSLKTIDVEAIAVNENAMKNCTSYIGGNTIKGEYGVTEDQIGNYAFYGCSSIESIPQ